MARHIAGLDGIRAIAVTIVCLAHLRVPGFQFGFVGVDLFFVLSGFLITWSLAHRRSSTFLKDYAEFWARRIMRLWPSLFATVLLCVAAAFLIGAAELGEPQRDLRYAIAALSLWLNIALWRDQTDYFRSDDPSPLLHLWSLSVEEQFYLVFPLIFFGLATRSRLRMWVLVAAGLASFGLCLAFKSHPILSYYNMPTRAWQLLAGALIALLVVDRTQVISARVTRAAAVVATVGLIAMTRIAEIGYPGYMALLPTMVASALIVCQLAPSPANLSYSWLTAVGRRSYVLYLVHWPITLVANYYLGGGPAFYVIAVLAMVLAAEAMHRWIEVPYMHGWGTPAWATNITGVAGAAALCALAYCAGRWADTYAQSTVVGRQRLEVQSARYDLPLACQSFRRPFTGLAAAEDCLVRHAGSQKLILVWGDSHAAHYGPLFAELGPRLASNVLVRAMGSCPPIAVSDLDLGNDGGDCRRFNAFVEAELVSLTQKFNVTVALSARWGAYGNTRETAENADRGVLELLGKIQLLRVPAIVMQKTPILQMDPWRCLLRNMPCRAEYEGTWGPRFLPDAIKVVEIGQWLCPQSESCPLLFNDKVIFSDRTHLSAALTRKLGQTLDLKAFTR